MVTRPAMSPDPLGALLEVVHILEELGIEYAVGGSVASSVFGEPRASADADIIVGLTEVTLPALVARLEPRFYVSEDAARDAVRRRSSFNAIHFDSTYKIDLFVAAGDLLDREQLARRMRLDLSSDPGSGAYVTAPENLVLRKLDWYRRAGGVSDQQWRDVLGVLKVQAPTIDVAYLRDRAGQVGLSDLLEGALVAAGLAAG
jgi:hypothetical protein